MIARVTAIGLVLALGCRGPGSSPYLEPSKAPRETAEAERLTQEAAELIELEPERAESLLRQALAKDIFFGPAHNNLGVVHLGRGELYEAANEFEWARKLMPGHPDPRLNLGITLERAGRTDEAIAAYTASLEVYPGYLPAIQGLAQLAVQDERDDDELRGWLQEIAMRGETESWRRWADVQLGRRRMTK